jgi:hypothetical protein
MNFKKLVFTDFISYKMENLNQKIRLRYYTSKIVEQLVAH